MRAKNKQREILRLSIDGDTMMDSPSIDNVINRLLIILFYATLVV
jgi:hypothetical protein